MEERSIYNINHIARVIRYEEMSNILLYDTDGFFFKRKKSFSAPFLRSSIGYNPVRSKIKELKISSRSIFHPDLKIFKVQSSTTQT